MDPVRVLLVDDERDIVDTVKYSLELRGYDVDVAYDGESALEAAEKTIAASDVPSASGNTASPLTWLAKTTARTGTMTSPPPTPKRPASSPAAPPATRNCSRSLTGPPPSIPPS